MALCVGSPRGVAANANSSPVQVHQHALASPRLAPPGSSPRQPFGVPQFADHEVRRKQHEKELLMKTEHSTAVQSKARSALSSASEHEAIDLGSNGDDVQASQEESTAEHRPVRF